MIVIGFSGVMGSGKTLAADSLAALLQHTGHTCQTFAFADELKRIARTEFGWDGEKDAKGRKLLQVLGTEAGRVYNSDIWVEKTANAIRQAESVAAYDTCHHEDGTVAMRCESCGAKFPNADISASDWEGACCDDQRLAHDAPLFIAILHDVRFPNEVAWIKEQEQGLVFFLEREGHEGDSHASETSFPPKSKYDATIQNKGSRKDYEDDVWNMVRRLAIEKGFPTL